MKSQAWFLIEDDVRRAPLLQVTPIEQQWLRELLRQNDLGHGTETLKALQYSLDVGYLDPEDREVLYGIVKARLNALSSQGVPQPDSLVHVSQRLKPQTTRRQGVQA